MSYLMTTTEKRFSTLLLLVASSLWVSGCFENTLGTNNSISTSTLLNSSANSLSTNTFTISTVSITAPSSGSSSSNLLTSIFLNTNTGSPSITSYCSTSNASQGCLCQFNWQEVLSTTGNPPPLNRSVQSTLITVQPNLVTCNAPQVYQTQIPVGTTVQISVVNGPNNPTTFTSSTFNYNVVSSTTGGSFTDAAGDAFENIVRYSCYEEYSRGLAVASQIVPVPLSSSASGATTAPMVSANQYCVASANGSGSTSSNCTGQLPANSFTAQANYYNLYIRQNNIGDINAGNTVFTCPMVKEGLNSNGSAGSQGQPWPLDATFALALSPSTTFSIGVEGFSTVANGSDPASANSASCSSLVTGASPSPSTGMTVTSGSSSGSLVAQCLGFAMPPNSNGTCPYFKDQNNQIRFTYRLRRYVALYPNAFDTTGAPINGQGQLTDTVYVIDRPVTSPNPLQPYTMKGPKPCPFAYFDRKGITGVSDPAYLPYTYPSPIPSPSACVAPANATYGGRPTYAGTNNAGWTGANYDGVQFPNQDTINSCSAAIPVPNSTYLPSATALTIATINAANPAYKELYVRPVTAWAPHYEEDTDFKACAPLAQPFQDPPLHFSKDSAGNVSWCAEAYPTQNPNVVALDAQDISPTGAGCPAVGEFIGRVEPFTSHGVKNSASAVCNDTSLTSIPNAIPSGYPSVTGAGCPAPNALSTPQAYALHPQDLVIDAANGQNICAPNTCDRTVVSTSLNWQRFPLLARPSQVEAAMTADPSYDCTITYDNNGPKTGVSSPSGGCCGPVVYMTTGLTGNSSAHLEPNVACSPIPAY